MPANMDTKDVLREAKFYLLHSMVDLLEQKEGEEMGINTILKDTKWRILTNNYLEQHKYIIFKAIGDASQKGELA